jgi:hypothetical protein
MDDDIIDLVSLSGDESGGDESGGDEAGGYDTIIWRGPDAEGPLEVFDPFRCYGNTVALSASQAQFLRNRVAEMEPYIPYYVCTLNEAMVVGDKAKMVHPLSQISFLSSLLFFLIYSKW